MAVTLAKHENIHIAGVDIIETNSNELYILECNRNPQFEGFEKATGSNVAQHIIEYLYSLIL